MTKFIVDNSDANIRIDAYLANILDGVSRSKIQNIIKSQNILINEKTCKPSQTLKPDDIITFDDSVFEEIKIEPENIPLDIVYENENFAIINKPSGMLTHPTSTQKTGTLVNALLSKYSTLSDLNGQFRKGIIHRLDKNTSGLLLIAKTTPLTKNWHK